MAISHIKSLTIPDFTGAVTVIGSDGITTTANATDIVRPSDWNSGHYQLMTIGGNTAGVSTFSGTDIQLFGGANLTLSGNGNTITFVGPNVPAQSAYVFSNSNGITFGTNASTVTASYNSTQFAGTNTSFGGTNISGSMTMNSGGLTISASVANPGGGGGAAISAAGSSQNAGTVVFSNSNNVSFGMNGSTITASAAAGGADGVNIIAVNGVATSLSTTMTLSNSNNITFGLNAGVITASASYSQSTNLAAAAAGTQTQTTGTLVFSNSNGISFGMSNSSVVTASYTVPTQSTQPVAVSGSNGSFAFSTLTMGNLNGLSFYTSNGSVVGSYTVPTQSVQPVAVSGSNGSFAFSTLTMGNLNGASFYTSNGSLVASYTVPVVTNSSWTVSDNATSATVGRLAFTNLNGVTLSLSTGAGGNHTIVGSVAAAGGAQTGISSIAGGGTTYTSGSIQFVNSYNVSISSTTGQGFVFSASYPVQSAVPGHALGVSNTGNTLGNTGTNSSGTIVFAASGNITASQSTAAGQSTIWFSVPNQSTAPGAIAAGTQTATSGTIVFSNSNNVSFTMNGSTQVVGSASFPAQSVQPVAVSGSNGSFAFSTLTMGNSNGMSFYSTNGSIVGSYTVPTQTNQSAIKGLGATNTGNTAGNTGISTGVDWVFAGTNNVTVSESTAAGGPNTLWISGPTVGGAQTGISGIVVSNTTYTSGTVSFSNANGISFGSSAGQAITASYTVPVVTNSSWTVSDSATSGTVGRLAFTNLNGMTLSLSTGAGGSHTIVGSYTVPSTVGLISAINVSGSNTSGNVTQLVFANSNNMSFGLSTAGGGPIGTITASFSQSNQTEAWYVQGNTTGQSSSSTINATSFNVSGAGIASVGWSASSLIISVPAGGGGGDGYNIVSMGTSTYGGGTGGATFSSLSDTLGLYAGSNITLSQTSNSIIFYAPAGGGGFTGSWFQPEVYGNTLTQTLANGTVYIRPFELDGYFDGDKLDMYHSFASSRSTFSLSASVSAGNASSGSGSWGISGTYIVFSRLNTNETNASYNSIISYQTGTWTSSGGYSASVSWSTNVSSCSASWTTSGNIGYISQIDGAGGVTTTNLGTTGSSTFSSTSNAANSFSSSYSASLVYSNFSGMRAIFAPMAGGNIPPGEYWMGIIQSTNTGSTNMPSLMSCASMSDAGRLFFTASTNNYLEIGNSVAFTTSGIRPIYGSANVSSATTTAIALSTFSSLSSYMSMWFAIDGRTK